MAVDIPANASTTQTIKLSSSKSSSVGFVNDEDWFKISLKAGNSYNLQVLGSRSGGGTLADPFLNLYNGSGQLIASNDDGHPDGRSALLKFRPTVSGTYYLGARSFGSGVGTYKASFLLDDAAASTLTDRTVKLGANAFRIDPAGDIDWASINLSGGRTYRFALSKAAGSNPSFDPIVEIRNAQGTLLAQDDDSGGNLNALLNFTPGSSGKYFVAVRDFGNNDVGNANLQISLA